MELKRILCLDLDGTVRRSKSGKTFIEGPDDVEIIPGMNELIWKYSNEGWIVFFISNQDGVAHGFKSMEIVLSEIRKTVELLKKDGMLLHLLFSTFCPADQKGSIAPYNFRSLCRKPNYGMLAVLEQDIEEDGYIPDWDNSLFVGDRPEDEQCAKSAGIPFMWAHDFLKQDLPLNRSNVWVDPKTEP